MSSVLEIACLLGDGPEAGTTVALLSQLASLLDQGSADDHNTAADDLDSVLFDLTPALLRCAAQSPAAERQVRRVLTAAAQRCTAREVFTLGMAALGEQLSSHAAEAPPPAHGPASPAFQLFLLGTLCHCLPRIRRRPLHFAAELLHMQLHWAAEVLPGLPLGDSHAAAAAAAGTVESGATVASESSRAEAAGESSATVAGAVASLARLAAQMGVWLQQQGSESSQMKAEEQQAAAALLGMILLQLAGLIMQLPEVLQASEAAVAAAAHAQPGSTSSIGAPPTVGSRLPAMHVAAEQLLVLPQVLLRQVPALASAGGGSTSRGRRLQELAAAAHDQLASSGLDPEELSYFSSVEAEEGAAAAVCAEALDPATAPQQQAAALQQVLPQAVRQLVDLGAQHKSVALSLLPLGALCAACGAVARSAAAAAAASSGSSSGSDCRLAAATPPLTALLAALVAIMSHNPVQLVRSCAHDALQALLDALQPAARLEQLRLLMQMPSTAAAVVALQRLRQEMAAAWPVRASGQREQAQQHAAGSGGSQLWMSQAALGLALPCLEHGTEAGWHDEGGVLRQADVQAAALSLLRWVLLREAAAPLGLLPHPAAERLLRRDLQPLQACVLRLLSAPRDGLSTAGAGENGTSAGGSGVAAAVLEQQQQLDSYLAVQRLHEALGCVIELIEAPPSSAS